MNWMLSFKGLSLGLAAVLTFAVAGCSESGTGTAESGTVAGHDDHGDEHEHGDGHAHGQDGWWCAEHGVPEKICAQCDKSMTAEFKAKGDWCDEHNRPASQCFICSPELGDKFIAQYEAKEGHKPPERKEEDAS
ncbi:RND transporter [Gimesia maris]|uniref:RND transporter n=1 Tax=Planctomycetia TaxID=203683 RepID=UPI003A929F99